MTAYVLILTASLLASVHCVGMCGCFALLSGNARSSASGRFLAQALYTCGRLFTYVFLGMAAGTFGTFVWEFSPGRAAITVLSVLSGVVFVVAALEILGVWRRVGRSGRSVSQLLTLGLGPLIQHFSGRQTAFATFAMGVFTGLLPCGLVYAFALAAAASGSPLTGGMTMLAFGLGTAPAMVTVGIVGGVLGARQRQQLYRLSAVVLLVLGIVTILRGTPVASHLMGHNHVVSAAAAPINDPVCDEAARNNRSY